ncbi:MAG: cupin [Candidatus Omnitrophica bacterium CG11_big_fil_rev_8_21_14_0_20_42_13]|uniref:Cupin n=1 Tax=Candidatus Ghiorseimicrobium undicola TaxID=1974746 RepID=A0A2H0LXI2_9BACT|nr:MAG: cupin [Candidatus Omnitrophica bacterium CG11_big_fil_rev_8_21_14_0_20_42_13]
MEDLSGNVLKLAQLLEYQDGAVLSRQIIKKNSASITIFAFEQGEGLSEHTAPFEAFVYIVEGEAEITISGKKNLVKGGEMLIMPANQPHALNALKRFKMLLVMIRS